MATTEKIDLAGWKNDSVRTTEGLLAAFDGLLQKTKEAVGNMSEEDFAKNWAMMVGETVIMTLSKREAVQYIYLHHIIHHRAQLGVYLRLLEVPIPGMYGPSADFK